MRRRSSFPTSSAAPSCSRRRSSPGLIPNPWFFLGIWVAGGTLAFFGAMAYAELAVGPAPRRRRVRLSRRRLRPRRRVPDGLDVVHRRVHRRHRDQRGGSSPSTSIDSCPARRTRRRCSSCRCRTCRSPSRRRRSWRSRRSGCWPSCTSAASATAGDGEHPRRAEGVGAADLHRARVCVRHRRAGQPRARSRTGGAEQLALRVHPGDARLLRLERGVVCRRRNPRSRPQRAEGAGHRHASP